MRRLILSAARAVLSISSSPATSAAVRWMRPSLDLFGAMRLTVVALAATVGALALLGAPSTSAQPTGASLQLEGVPARLTVPGSFTITVSGSTGTTSHASIYPIYGPAPCAATVDAQLAASPDESLLGPESDEAPAFGFAGPFSVRARGLGEFVGAPGLYTVCVFMEAPEQSEPGEGPEEEAEDVIAVASGTFTVLPSSATSPTTITRGAPRSCSTRRGKGRRHTSAEKLIGRSHCSVPPRCVVPHIRGRRLRSAENAIARAHCAVGTVRKVGSRHVRKGRVMWQSRRAGKSLPAGARVGLLVSQGVSRSARPPRVCAGAHLRGHRLRCPKHVRRHARR